MIHTEKQLKEKETAIKKLVEFNDACKSFCDFLFDKLKASAQASLKYGKNEAAERMLNIDGRFGHLLCEQCEVYFPTPNNSFDRKIMSIWDVWYAIENDVDYREFVKWVDCEDHFLDFSTFHSQWDEPLAQWFEICNNLAEMWELKKEDRCINVGEHEFKFRYGNAWYVVYFSEAEIIIKHKAPITYVVETLELASEYELYGKNRITRID